MTELKFSPATFETDVDANNISESDELYKFLSIYTASQSTDGEPVTLTESLIYKYLDRLDESSGYVMHSDEDDVVGAALVSIEGKASGKRMWIEGIAIDPEHRNMGIGKFAIRKLAQIALDNGCEKMSGLAKPHESTLAFYRELGFYHDDTIGNSSDYDDLVPMSVDLNNMSQD